MGLALESGRDCKKCKRLIGTQRHKRLGTDSTRDCKRLVEAVRECMRIIVETLETQVKRLIETGTD